MNRSETLGKLAEALSLAQGAMKNAVKDSNNPFFKSKYADLASVSDACRAELSANGLAVVQLPTMREGKMVLEYVLVHSSGEFIGSELEMTPVKSDPQGIGSAITYARRYTLAGIAGVATEDDDGNAASQGGKSKNVERTTEDVVIERKPKESEIGGASSVGSTAPPLGATESAAENDSREIDGNGFITLGQQANLHRQFKAAMAVSKRKEAELYVHSWLRDQGYVDAEGNGTAKTIPENKFFDVRAAACAFAATIQ